MEENMQGESSMDEKAFLLQEIRYSKRKQNVKKFLRYESTGIAAGGTIAMVLEGCAVFVPFYTVHVWAVLAVLCGAAAGGIYTVMKRCTMVQAAQKIDRFGFQERIVTAYGRIGKEGSIDRMQRSDAVHMLQEDHAWKKARVCPNRRYINGVGKLHPVMKKKFEKNKEIKKVMDALKQTDTSSMTKEQKKALQELIQSLALSQKEMQQADTKQALASAGQKLSYKYGQAAQISGADVLASVLKNIQVNTNTGNQLAQGDVQSTTQNTTQSGTQRGESTQSSETSSQDSGDGEDSGSGKGTGSGNGSGTGNGTGSGRGTGSGGGTHDYVSVPNKLGNDSSITKDKGDSKNSDYYKAKNGLAWKGEHVDLDSVVGDYTKEAYEGIANGKYPAGMEDVIRNYFENLN